MLVKPQLVKSKSDENTMQFVPKGYTGTLSQTPALKNIHKKLTKAEELNQIPKLEFHFLSALALVPETIFHENVF